MFKFLMWGALMKFDLSTRTVADSLHIRFKLYVLINKRIFSLFIAWTLKALTSKPPEVLLFENWKFWRQY